MRVHRGKTDRPVKVFCTVPCVDNMSRHVVYRLLQLQADERYQLDFCFPSFVPSEASRSHALGAFLEGEYDFWLSIDADNPPSRNPLDLVELDLDLVGCPTPVWQYSGDPGLPTLIWNVYRVDAEGNHLPYILGKGLQRVDAIGTGCFLAARRVFTHCDLIQGPFARHWSEDGTIALGSDLALCERVRAANYEIWVHWDHLCSHYSPIDLLEVMGLVGAARQAAVTSYLSCRLKPEPDGTGQPRVEPVGVTADFQPNESAIPEGA